MKEASVWGAIWRIILMIGLTVLLVRCFPILATEVFPAWLATFMVVAQLVIMVTCRED